jgi:hypothetical protein
MAISAIRQTFRVTPMSKYSSYACKGNKKLVAAFLNSGKKASGFTKPTKPKLCWLCMVEYMPTGHNQALCPKHNKMYGWLKHHDNASFWDKYPSFTLQKLMLMGPTKRKELLDYSEGLFEKL